MDSGFYTNGRPSNIFGICNHTNARGFISVKDKTYNMLIPNKIFHSADCPEEAALKLYQGSEQRREVRGSQ